jgi:hypothetical protein
MLPQPILRGGHCYCWKGKSITFLFFVSTLHDLQSYFSISLLPKSLHERPLAGTGNVDLVIYAAQLSQSFFSCLAGAIEGFLDLFLAPTPTDKKDFGLDEGSISTDTGSNLPAGALASIVLWCDSELSKFSQAFGGARILGNLSLSPPPRESPKKGPRVLGKSNISKDRQVSFDYADRLVHATSDLVSNLPGCVCSLCKECH